MKLLISKSLWKSLSANKESTVSYHGEHSSPDSKNGMPLHNLIGIYPADIYSHEAAKLYGDGSPFDSQSIAIIQSTKNKPNAGIKIYRALPYFPSPQEQINNLLKEKAYILKNGKIPPNANLTNISPKSQNSSQYYEILNQNIEKLNNILSTQEQTLNTLNKTQINPGDWVTISLSYAKDHALSNLKPPFKIISKTVPAKSLFTDGNSIHEWGYHP